MTEEEFARVVREFGTAVYRAAYAQTCSRSIAEDIFQESFLKLWSRPVFFKDDYHLKCWLLKVTTNLCRDHFKSAYQRKVSPTDTPLDPNVPESEDPQNGIVFDALARLPENERILLHLFYEEDYSIKEIARITGKSSAAVKTGLSRARKKLRTILLESEPQ